MKYFFFFFYGITSVTLKICLHYRQPGIKKFYTEKLKGKMGKQKKKNRLNATMNLSRARMRVRTHAETHSLSLTCTHVSVTP